MTIYPEVRDAYGLETPVQVAFARLYERIGAGTRIANAFHNECIVTLGDLLAKTKSELLRIPNFGKTSLRMVEEELSVLGYEFGSRSRVKSNRPRNWYAMVSAPRDGTRIIALLSDFSGVQMIRWGRYRDGRPGEEWFYPDWDLDAGDDADFAGWVPVPEGTPECKAPQS